MLNPIPKYSRGAARKIGQVCAQERGRETQNRKRETKASPNRQLRSNLLPQSRKCTRQADVKSPRGKENHALPHKQACADQIRGPALAAAAAGHSAPAPPAPG